MKTPTTVDPHYPFYIALQDGKKVLFKFEHREKILSLYHPDIGGDARKIQLFGYTNLRILNDNEYSIHDSSLGLRYNAGKPDLFYCFLGKEVLEGEARVWEWGAKRYAPGNWLKGMSWVKSISSLLRHTLALLMGEENDSESGLPHVDHIVCCAKIISNSYHTRKDLDDRPKRESENGGTGETLVGAGPRDSGSLQAPKGPAARTQVPYPESLSKGV